MPPNALPYSSRAIALGVPAMTVTKGESECMNHAYEEHSPLLPFLKALPAYDEMRSDRRYDELLCRIGLACDARR